MTETEKEAFIHRLYEKHRGYLRNAALIYGASQSDADDFVHDVFEIAMKKANMLMKHENHIIWLVKVLENCIRNNRRLRANRFNRSLEDCSDLPAPERAESLSHILPSQLSDREKQILIWRFEENIDYREMSERLGLTEEYCRVKVSRIIKKCRELMKEE